MKVHLVDGTYELFRQHFGMAVRHGSPHPMAGAAGVVASTLQLVAGGATHIGVASDHVIESFRNGLWAGYKTGEGMEPALLDQIPVMEDALAAFGFTVWPMVDHEADDALASAAATAEADARVEQALIVTPDKDLGQCVRGERIVQYDRRKDEVIDAAEVTRRFGVPPSSIADYLALVGDQADGYPGLPGWGAKSAAAVLARYGRLEDVPTDGSAWDVPGLRGVERLATTLRERFDEAVLFRQVATVVTDVAVGTVDDWRWMGPTDRAGEAAHAVGAPALVARAEKLAAARR